MATSPRPGVSSVASSQTQQAPRRSVFQTLSLTNQVAVITGGARGIGLEIAQAFAEAGAVAYCLDLPEKPNEEFVKVSQWVESLPDLPAELILSSEKDGRKKGRLVYARADVTDQMEMWRKLEKIYEVEGRVDIIKVNVDGAFYTAQAAARQMKKHDRGGSIIFTASMSGSISNQGQPWSAYTTSKAAVVQMARSMACELGKDKIRVNSVSPGYIYTEMTKQFLLKNPETQARWSSQNPLGRIGFPDELRSVYLWLAGNGSSFCTGSDILVDGGHRAW
ncbi:sorbose reductase SOU1 [Coprinopsis cinerea okayama7|uniref:Sorbose reductase SOU1 n=1 Tax=Coprinopsis cinerea (strain Okayama-7 / 130 / ATCC MYA-4618 / FGSC 9003) TaxID=240176 RepID=A8NCW2_COPC7|nr:sorbose reductase SOU1 [Coprinopsis cinerea okayama7\|eukprot:XP_001832642.2 sorbose reductase SOU1 [Coprinopsis cinerea okayama7\